MNRAHIRATDVDVTVAGGTVRGRVVVVEGSGGSAFLAGLLAEALRTVAAPIEHEEPAPRGAQWKREKNTRVRK